MNKKRITVFVGHFGSGKTEVAINYTLHLGARLQEENSNQEARTAIVDLDIVNPYFRSREVRSLMEEQGIKVVASAEGFEAADIPALSPAVYGVLQDERFRVVLDVGGDNLGATALGRFRANLREGEYDLYLVVNPYRPFTRTPEAIQKMLEDIQAASRLKVTGLVSNPNLGLETKADTVLEGHPIVCAAADQLGLPVAFLAVKDELLEEVTGVMKDGGQPGIWADIELFPLKIFMLPPWHENPGKVVTDTRTRMQPGLGRV